VIVTLGELERNDFNRNPSDSFAALFAVFSSLMLGFLIIFIIYILKFDPDQPGLMGELHKFIYADISMRNRYTSWFMFVFLLRRTLFVLIIYFGEQFLGLQLILHIILTLFYVAYFAVVKPYKDPHANEWEIFNEIFVVLISYTLMFLSQYDEDFEIRMMIGLGYCGLISINLALNAYKIFKNLVIVGLP
jgi:hypothetical protein